MSPDKTPWIHPFLGEKNIGSHRFQLPYFASIWNSLSMANQSCHRCYKNVISWPEQLWRKRERKCRVSGVALLNFYTNARHAHMNNNIYIYIYIQLHMHKKEYYLKEWGASPADSPCPVSLCKWKVKTFMCTFFTIFYGTLLRGVAAGWPTQHYATSRCDFALFMTFMLPPDRPKRHKYCCKAKNK